MKKRIFGILAALLAFLLILQGCNSEPGGGGLTQSQELRVCIGEELYNGISPSLSKFQQDNKDLAVNFDIIPSFDAENEDAYQTLVTRIRNEAMAGNGPDVYILQPSYASAYRSMSPMAEDFFTDINKVMRSGVFCDLLPIFAESAVSLDGCVEKVLEAGKVGDKLYTLPLTYTVESVLTNDASRAVIDESGFSGYLELLNGLSTLVREQSPMPQYAVIDGFLGNMFWNNPYFYTASPMADYDAKTAEADTPFIRSMLQMSKDIRSLSGKGDMGLIKPAQDEYREYITSPNYFNISISWGQILDAETNKFLECTPNLDAVPTEDGGVRAIVTCYGAIASGSDNTLYAAKLLAALLDPDAFSTKANPKRQNLDWNYHIKSGTIADNVRYFSRVRPLTDILTDYIAFTRPDTELSDGLVSEFAALEGKITDAVYPPPGDFSDIVGSYYNGFINIDECISEMQRYWDVALSE